MTQKNKNILLVVGFCLALILVYRFSIADTFEIKKELNQLETQKIAMQNIPIMMANLNQKEVFLDSVLSSNNIKGTSVQNTLLTLLNEKSSNGNFKIIEFNEPNRAPVEGATLVSYSFGLEGSFEDIIEIIYMLEQENSIGKITHLEFVKERDFRKRKDYLECKVILENLVSN